MDNSETSKGKLIVTWLFNPFHYIAGGKALVIGLVVILLTGLIGSFSNTHFDGVLDIHTGLPAPTWVFLMEGLVDWLSLGIPLCVVALIFTKSKVRLLDVFGTQALARFPMIVNALLSLLPGFQRQIAQLPRMGPQFSPSDIVPMDMAVFAFVLLCSLTMLVWMVALMYRAYAVSCNIRGGKRVVLFIAALLVGEVISKVVLIVALNHLGLL
ncbi:hypothetical protein ACFL1X_08890 [Candidatus Hydrogenedentota bacterium]